MADSDEKQNGMQVILKPFYQRASEAEERLSKLEASLATTKKDSGDYESEKLVSQLRAELEEAKSEQMTAQEKIKDLEKQNAKLEYRIIHLIRAVRVSDEEVLPQ
ncbi:hypothetical protein MKX03_032755 [Papaver bracteatum]|nr:hypothetical protein MKX03_032755 [Papaver bracteatum]